MLGWVLPASGVGAGLLRVDDLPPAAMVPLVDEFVTSAEDVEVGLSEVKGSPWPIKLGSIWVWVVDELSYGRQARAVATAG